MKLLSVLFGLLLAVGVSSFAQEPNAITCELSVFQKSDASGEYLLLQSDTAVLVEGVEAVGFLSGVSVDLLVRNLDSARVELTLHAHTPPPRVDNVSKDYTIEYGLPAWSGELTGKAEQKYRVKLIPLRQFYMDQSGCSYQHQSPESFSFNPSAHLDIYFVPNSLGDYNWNNVKSIMESEYEGFRDFNRFSVPGKFYLYLCPCRIPSVIWDDRFAMMVDPSRGAMYALYSTDLNTTYPFLLHQAAIFRNYGYAPAFLSEGFANYSSFTTYGMRKLLRDGRTIPLDSLLDTQAYMSADPEVADLMSGSFVRFLIDRYGLEQFVHLYQQTHDLNLRRQLTLVYGQSIDEMEAEWLEAVASSPISLQSMRYFASQAEAMFDYDKMREYSQLLVSHCQSSQDSLRALPMLARACFFFGDYQKAASETRVLIALGDTAAIRWMSLGTYQMMAGDLVAADSALRRAEALAPDNDMVRFNRARWLQQEGDRDSAEAILERLVLKPSSGQAGLEAKALWGHLLLTSDRPAAKDLAVQQFSEVVALVEQASRGNQPVSGVQHLWAGVALLGLDEPDEAIAALRVGELLETRPFYRGMIQLWMGRAADLSGDRELARVCYNHVINNLSAAYYKAEAKKHLETPYQLSYRD